MARPHVTPPEPIDLTDQRIQIGDTTAFVTKFNTTQDQFERFSTETDAYTTQLSALGDYLEQRADSADADAAATAADRLAVAGDKTAVAVDRAAVADDKTAVASDRQAVETAASQVANDQQTVATDKTAVATGRAAVESAASQVANDASAAAESADSASSSAQTAAQLRDQTQALRDQAEAIVVDDDVRAAMRDAMAGSAVTITNSTAPGAPAGGSWSIQLRAMSRQVGGQVVNFAITWWDGQQETIYPPNGVLFASHAVDRPVGETVTATVTAYDDIGNESEPYPITATVSADAAPTGTVSIGTVTQAQPGDTIQFAFTGATDPDGGSVMYQVVDEAGLTWSKTTGIVAGEIVTASVPLSYEGSPALVSACAVSSRGVQGAAATKSITISRADIIGVSLLETGGPGGTWQHIDVNGNAIARPSTSWFNSHPVWGGMSDQMIDGQHMVFVPRFYYKRGEDALGNDAWWISPVEYAGFTLMPAFMYGGRAIDGFWVGKYQASLIGDELASRPWVLPAVSKTLAQFMTHATNRNSGGVQGFRIWHYDMWLAVQWLYLIENATMDSQAHTGRGRVSTGSAASVSTADVAEATYRGIVGLWGNVYQWMDGARALNDVIERRSYNGSWTSTGESVSNSGSANYPLTFRPSSPQQFIAGTYRTGNGNATLPDYVRWRNGGEYYPFVGGSWSTAASAGLWYVNCGGSASSAYSHVGARLARVV
ncbi:hypothetical protein BFW38_03395 [Terasakiispira papahanaumokuakeensis]|uniref:Uncharacterized protein n=1 Tax=Terasakiispira papahanaumokuakeensis TaxID=197479 RepID=A0A1E2V7A3_9GAMM|nr:hypothetical protein [Terasakiispira papahanaumokuakeensis]ODC02732.1 hypothetical protein BFW38_03395 [Terasakiispira papahanaumokuakeensis]